MEPVPSSFSLLHLASVRYRGMGKQEQMGDCPQGGMEMGERGLIPQGVGIGPVRRGPGGGWGQAEAVHRHTALRERVSHCHLCV